MMFDFDKAYDSVTDSYLIHKKYITKGIKKNIEQTAENCYMSYKKDIYRLSETYEGSLKYIKEMWGNDKNKKIPLDDVTKHSLSVARYKQYTANNCTFIDNIARQGWISYKQYLVIREIILRSNANASWENDEDTELSKDYYGLQGT